MDFQAARLALLRQQLGKSAELLRKSGPLDFNQARLDLLRERLAAVSKGDVPGHEFHGNQYVEGHGEGGHGESKRDPVEPHYGPVERGSSHSAKLNESADRIATLAGKLQNEVNDLRAMQRGGVDQNDSDFKDTRNRVSVLGHQLKTEKDNYKSLWNARLKATGQSRSEPVTGTPTEGQRAREEEIARLAGEQKKETTFQPTGGTGYWERVQAATQARQQRLGIGTPSAAQPSSTAHTATQAAATESDMGRLSESVDTAHSRAASLLSDYKEMRRKATLINGALHRGDYLTAVSHASDFAGALHTFTRELRSVPSDLTDVHSSAVSQLKSLRNAIHGIAVRLKAGMDALNIGSGTVRHAVHHGLTNWQGVSRKPTYYTA